MLVMFACWGEGGRETILGVGLTTGGHTRRSYEESAREGIMQLCTGGEGRLSMPLNLTLA